MNINDYKFLINKYANIYSGETNMFLYVNTLYYRFTEDIDKLYINLTNDKKFSLFIPYLVYCINKRRKKYNIKNIDFHKEILQFLVININHVNKITDDIIIIYNEFYNDYDNIILLLKVIFDIINYKLYTTPNKLLKLIQILLDYYFFSKSLIREYLNKQKIRTINTDFITDGRLIDQIAKYNYIIIEFRVASGSRFEWVSAVMRVSNYF